MYLLDRPRQARRPIVVPPPQELDIGKHPTYTGNMYI